MLCSFLEKAFARQELCPRPVTIAQGLLAPLGQISISVIIGKASLRSRLNVCMLSGILTTKSAEVQI